jgi:crossover junction endodeoxyribonuclease RusA
MLIITTRSLIREVAARWRSQYREPVGDKLEIAMKLDALDPGTASADAVNAIIGNSSWTSMTCNECRCRVAAVVRLGEEPDFESHTADICFDCLAKAVALARGGHMLTVTLPWPVSANVYWRTRVVKGVAMTYVSAEAKEYKRAVDKALVAAGFGGPILGRVAVSMTLYPHRPQDWQKRMKKLGDAWDDGVRSIDLDNAIKVTLDAMKGVAFEDDVWVRRIVAERAEPDGEARLVVTISAIETSRPQQNLPICTESQTRVSAALFDPLEV